MEAAMRHDDEDKGRGLEEHLEPGVDEIPEESHVVFDFTGLEQPNIGELSLILTARLRSAAHENVWVRSLPPRTARVLAILGLDHLFRTYPEAADEMN
jgi:anti-anti-sigma regulatory factor